MEYMLKEIRERSEPVLDRLLALWGRSVRETHRFLSSVDVNALVPSVRQGLTEVTTLIVTVCASGEIAGFMGIESSKLEMLFIDPAYRSQGIGRRMLEHAMEFYHVDSVDVNEQNPAAKGFYEHMGFKVHGRSATDGQGNSFPLLHLRLR